MKRILIVATLLGIATPGHAQNAEQNAIVWQSRNDTFVQLTQEFASLYRDLLGLHMQGRTVPTKVAEVPAGKTITETLRERGLFDGDNLPRQLDILVCKLNADVCKVQLGKSGDLTGDDASAIWKIKAGQAIVVPEIDFKPFVVHKPYRKSAGDTLKKIVVDDRRGCDSYDDACVRYLQNLNRRLDAPLSDEYAGKITVPTKAYRAVISFTRPTPSVGESAMRVEVKDPESGNAAASGSAPRPSSVEDILKLAPALGARVVPPAAASLHAAEATATATATAADAAPEGSRALLLELIKHPLSGAGTLVVPDSPKSVVAVFDSWVDKAHCMLSKVTVLDTEDRAIQRAHSCGDRGDATTAQDHGTHVVGVIGMRLDAVQGPGVNPYASIKALSINKDQFANPVYATRQADRLRNLYRTDSPDVVNISFSYTPSPAKGSDDAFHAAMKDQEGDTLFVVSAGNDGSPLSRDSDCRVLPACYDDMNVVTVGALDLSSTSPGMMHNKGGDSNYGNRVHLAAPGENIVSTIAGDRMGIMSGTSQAAPAVTGAASLLYLFEHRLRPSQVKNRLIYTCDLYPGLYDKVQGGRLNVQRFLAYKTALVNTAGGRHIAGGVGDPSKLLRFVDFETHEAFLLRFVQIRRLALNPEHGHYTLFYNDDIGRDTGRMKRRLVTLQDPSARLGFSVPIQPGEPGKLEEILLKDLIDYVSPLLL